MKPFPSFPRILKWLFTLYCYFAFVFGFGTGGMMAMSDVVRRAGVAEEIGAVVGAIIGGIVVIIILGGLMRGVAWAYNKDKEREYKELNDFKGNNLFYRYGDRITNYDLTIQVKPEWSDREINRFVSEMRSRISSKIKERFSSENIEVVYPIIIKDAEREQDSRKFLKVLFRSRRNSQVSHFINYDLSGKCVVVHYLSRVRGTYHKHDVIDLILLGPITIWAWGIKWWQNQYSIIKSMSKIENNSFDIIDLNTFFSTSYFVFLDETRSFLKEKGLLTDEINQFIVNNINNSQNISIKGSTSTNIGTVTNTVEQKQSRDNNG